MYWHRDICDKVVSKELRNNHLQSGFHKSLANLITRKYSITKSKPKKIDDTIRNYLRLHYKKYEKFLVILSVKLVLPPNQIKNNRRQYTCHRDQECINNAFFFPKIKIFKEQFYSQILELRITFVSRFENIRFQLYLTKPKSVLEWKLLAMFFKNPQIVHAFEYKRHFHPLFEEFSHIYLDDFYQNK